MLVNAQTVVMHACSKCIAGLCLQKASQGSSQEVRIVVELYATLRSAHFTSAEHSLAACLLANPLGAFKQLSQALPTCARRIQVSVSKKPLYFYVNLAKARRLPPPPFSQIFTGLLSVLACACCEGRFSGKDMVST